MDAALVVGREKRRDARLVAQAALVQQRRDERRAVAQRGEKISGGRVAQNPALLASGHAASWVSGIECQVSGVRCRELLLVTRHPVFGSRFSVMEYSIGGSTAQMEQPKLRW